MSIAVSLTEPLALASRDDLVEAVKAEMNRSDFTDEEVREFIRRAEARFNRVLRHPQMEAVASAVLSSGRAALPGDFLQARAVYDSNRCAIPAVSALAAVANWTPKVHAIIGGNIQVSPETDETISLIYYAKLPPLSINVQSNWLLADHPDVYFYGTLEAFASRIGDSESTFKWRDATDAALAEVVEDGKRRRYGGPLLPRSTVTQVAGARI